MKTIIAVVVLVAALNISYAQHFNSTVSIGLGLPDGEYKLAYPKSAFGLGLSGMFQPAKGLLSFGGSLGYLYVSSNSRDFYVNNFGFQDVYRVTASSSIIRIAATIKASLLPRVMQSVIIPYATATIGANVFLSQITTERSTYYGPGTYSNVYDSKSNWALTYGPGLGIEIPVGRSRRGKIDLQCRYLFGSNTKYYTDPYVDVNGQVYFTRKESRTNMIFPEIGYGFTIGK